MIVQHEKAVKIYEVRNSIRHREKHTPEHSSIRNDEERSTTGDIDQHGSTKGDDKVENLQAAVDHCLSVGVRNADILQDEIDVVRHEAVTAEIVYIISAYNLINCGARTSTVKKPRYPK